MTNVRNVIQTTSTPGHSIRKIRESFAWRPDNCKLANTYNYDRSWYDTICMKNITFCSSLIETKRVYEDEGMQTDANETASSLLQCNTAMYLLATPAQQKAGGMYCIKYMTKNSTMPTIPSHCTCWRNPGSKSSLEVYTQWCFYNVNHVTE